MFHNLLEASLKPTDAHISGPRIILLIPLVVAFFKIPYQRTRIFGTFKAIGYVLFYDTILYLAFAAMFWFPLPDIEYLGGVIEHSWGQRVIRFYDLDGHIIEVGEDMRMVIKRFLASGMTMEEVSVKMDVSAENLIELLNS